MSIATQIQRIKTAKCKIRDKLVELKLASPTDNIDTLAAVVEGIENKGGINAEIFEGSTYTIPAGYHDGTGTVHAMTDVEGDYARYKTQAKTVTPTKSRQTVSPDTGNYALSAVTVEPIPSNFKDTSNITVAAADVLAGKIIIDKDGNETTGTMPNNGAVEYGFNAAHSEIGSYIVPKGYHNGKGTIYFWSEGDKYVTPTKGTQEITGEMVDSETQRFLTKVIVNPIPDNYLDTTDPSIAKGEGDLTVDGHVVNVAAGYYPQGVSKGVTKLGHRVVEINGLDAVSDAGYISYGVLNGYVTTLGIALTSDLEEALASI